MRALRRNLDLVNLVLVAGVLFITAYLLTQEQDRNTKIEATAKTATAIADAASLEQLRNCIRSNILSGTFHISQTPKNRAERTPAENRQADRIIDRLYPVLDCKRSLDTGTSVKLTEAVTRKYAAVVAKGRFPIVRDGRVIGSRTSLLEGVDSIDEVGTRPEEDVIDGPKKP